MKNLNYSILFFFTLFSFIVNADVHPAGSTALCKDGSYYSSGSKRGACSRHGGIKAWYGDELNQANSEAQAPAAATIPEPTRNQPKHESQRMARTNGTGQVWVNTDSKIYHCEGSYWYGKTKHGEYMSEAEAKSQGIRADHNKACR